ncbi:MAG: hypothetical protein WBK28_02750 [Minisyncoccia bacterium]
MASKKLSATEIGGYLGVALTAILFLSLYLLFLFGWRLGSDGVPVLTGTLVIQEVPQGTYVYVDQVRRHSIGASGMTSLRLLPGTHSVIVDAPKMQPWNELFAISSGATTALSPILVPKELPLRVLHGDERAAGAAALLAHRLPTKTEPLVMGGGCAVVYVASNRIVADATTTPSCAAPDFLLCPEEEGGTRTNPCPSSTVIYAPRNPLESIALFPGRDDALIVAAGGTSYIIELDPREPQFFVPLIQGILVRAVPWTEHSVIISDTQKVFELPLSR